MELKGAAGVPLGPQATATASDPVAVDRAARELEGAFAKLLIGSMRQAGFGDSLFSGAGEQQYRDLYDQQLAKVLTEGKGLGLAPMIRRQLGGDNPSPAAGATAPAGGYSLHNYARPQASRQVLNELAALGVPVKPQLAAALQTQAQYREPAIDEWQPTRPDGLAARTASAADGTPTPEQFVAQIWPHAQRAAAELGADPRTLVAQAALETGWGQRVIRHDDGGHAWNLFGIKASGRWQGESVARTTTEVENGVERREVAAFRAYGSPAESFADYVRLLKTSPRYADALASNGDGRRFAQSLQKAGYATDPRYAAKLTAIAEGPTLRKALAQLTPTPPLKA